MASCGTITVVPAFDQSNVSVTSCSTSTSNVNPGESVTYTAQVRNDNNVEAIADVVLYVDGATQVTNPISVPAASSKTATFNIDFDSAGDYSISAEVTQASRA